MCRKALEIICKNNEARGKNLFDRLESLKDMEKIDTQLLKWSHGIRAIGNDAAHDVDSSVSINDAQDALVLTEAILLYVYTLNTRFEEFEARRKKA